MKLVLVVLGASALVWAASAAGTPAPLRAPSGLHAFVYRADEPVKRDHTYALMPAFAWKAVQGGRRYDLELATSSTFADATVLYRHEYEAPVASVQLQVPWMTGHPYALWVRVRVHDGVRTSGWSRPFGFNTAWQNIPQPQAAPDGLIRWTPVEGATSYEIWFLNVPGNEQTRFTTLTNVADEREYWTFRGSAPGTIRWRVRADRLVTNPSLPNGIGVVVHGPYSKVYSTPTTSTSGGRLLPLGAVSNATSTPQHVVPHQLTPGFSWNGNTDSLNERGSGLYQVYVFSDRQCVNPVMTGSVVGGPAWAPRVGATIQLPQDTVALQKVLDGDPVSFGTQSAVYTADHDKPTFSEAAGSAATSPTPSDQSSSGQAVTPQAIASLSLPDNGWPQGRYWWTIVPVTVVQVPPPASAGSAPADPSKPSAIPLEYRDAALPQDLCAAGEVWPFGMQSAPLTTTSNTPYVSGVAGGTRVVSAASPTPSFQELPVITWKPAMSAYTYEVQLSRHLYPWSPVHTVTSVVSSAVLPLTRHDIGTWYYRVRGVNPNLVGPAQKLSWSKPVAIRISGDRFVVVK